MQYHLVVCGGTFDLLHKGHVSFLKQILEKTDKVIIGITSDTYVSKFKNKQTEDFKTR
ncbi:MAG: adenylyltransferase/cytidyltransferase family protein, partial [Patescibacteria group bacterium]